MTTLEAAGQLLAADVDNRTLSYRILPFGEQGRTSLGLVTASAGTIDLPADPAAVTLNLEHDYTRPVGRATSVTETDDGIDATFAVARTSAGNDLLAEAADGLRTGASVEISGPVIRDGRLIGGHLDAVASCVRPAFPSALLTASDCGEDPQTPTEAPAEDTTEEEEEEVMPDTQTTEAEAETQAETTTAAPAQLSASQRPAGAQAQPKRPKIETTREFARMLAAFHSTGDRDLLAALKSRDIAAAGDLFAALSDIKWDGTGGLSQTITQPQWLGNTWKGKRYDRRFIPLFQHADLTSLSLKGWEWGTKPEVAAWSGNKSAVPSGTVTASPTSGTAQRYAGAHDIAREFRDFNNEDFWSMYLEAMTDSYARVTDVKTLADVVAAATVVTPGTVPTDVPTGLVYIVDGALSMIDDIQPTFALVSKDLWRALVLTGKDNTLEFLTTSLGLEEGSMAGFSIKPANLTNDTVIVGAREAATVYELPGVPIRVEAENLANGGIDDGFFGYHGTFINNAEGIAAVTGGAGA